MRSLIVIAIVLIALIAGGLLAVPRLLVWENYRTELAAKAEAMTGQTVAIGGRIDLNLLPQPTLSLAQTTLASRPNALDRMRLEVDRMDLELKPLPLLRGRLDVEEVRLVRPVLQVDPAAADGPELPQLIGAIAWLPLTPGGPSRVTVVDGRAMLPEPAFGRVGRFEQVNLDLSTSGPVGAVVLDGTFALNNQPFRVDARLGRLTEEASGTLRLTLVAEGETQPGPSTLTFGGVVWWRSETPQLRGELSIAGGDARSAIGRFGEALGHHVMPMPSWLAAPFRLSGPVELADDRLELPALAVEFAAADLTGRLRLTLATQPEIDLVLDAARLAIPDDGSANTPYGELAPFGALASSVRGRLDLSVGALDYRGQAVRQLRASLELTGDGTAGIKEARAVLPGQTDVSFSGQLGGLADNPELRGELAAVTENLRATLAWLDLSPADVAEGRLSSLSLASQVSIMPDAWRFSDIELRVDASRATGAVAVSLAPRPRVAGTLALDRLDVDAYWPDQEATDVLARLAQPLGAFDAAIEAHLARLTWRGAQLLDLGFTGRAVDGRLTINELTVGDLAEARARLAGEVDLFDGGFDLSAQLRGVQAARLLRRLGLEPPQLLARLQPLSV
jgi:AsmA family